MKVSSVLYPLAPHTSLVPYAHPLCALFTLAFICSSIHQVLSWTSQSQGALCMLFFLPGWFSTSLLTDQFLRSLFKGHPPTTKKKSSSDPAPYIPTCFQRTHSLFSGAQPRKWQPSPLYDHSPLFPLGQFKFKESWLVTFPSPWSKKQPGT